MNTSTIDIQMAPFCLSFRWQHRMASTGQCPGGVQWHYRRTSRRLVFRQRTARAKHIHYMHLHVRLRQWQQAGCCNVIRDLTYGDAVSVLRQFIKSDQGH